MLVTGEGEMTKKAELFVCVGGGILSPLTNSADRHGDPRPGDNLGDELGDTTHDEADDTLREDGDGDMDG
jgi:hypothetical protein